MVADMVAFVASQFTTSTWDVGAQELCSVVLIKAPTMNECEEARGLRSFAFQKDSNYSKNLLERSV